MMFSREQRRSGTVDAFAALLTHPAGLGMLDAEPQERVDGATGRLALFHGLLEARPALGHGALVEIHG